MERDEHWMKLALELAKGGEGWVEPNPMVGCVVVCDGELISSGYHERFGGPHAEVQALRGLDAVRIMARPHRVSICFWSDRFGGLSWRWRIHLPRYPAGGYRSCERLESR